MSAQRLSRLNDGMSALTMGAPLTGLFEGEGSASLISYALAFLIVAMRVKFWIDDMDFFEDPGRGGARSDLVFRIGVSLGLVSWVLFIVAGIMVRQPPVAAAWLVAALVVSTLWLGLEIATTKAYPVQAIWSASNAGYIVLAACIVMSQWLGDISGLRAETVQIISIVGLGLILAIEIVKADWLQTLKTQVVEPTKQKKAGPSPPGIDTSPK